MPGSSDKNQEPRGAGTQWLSWGTLCRNYKSRGAVAKKSTVLFAAALAGRRRTYALAGGA